MDTEQNGRIERIFGIGARTSPPLWERAGIEFREMHRAEAEKALLAFSEAGGLSRHTERERAWHLSDYVLESVEAGRQGRMLLALDLLSRLPGAEAVFLGTLLRASQQMMNPRVWRLMAVARPQLGALPEEKRAAFLRRLLRHRPGERTDVEGLILPEVTGTWAEALARVQSDHLEQDEDLLRWTYDTTDRGGLSFEEYLARARRGEALGRLTEELVRFKPFGAAAGEGAAAGGRAHLRALARDMGRNIIPFSEAPVRAHEAAGRSSVITITHSGFMAVMREYTWTAVPDITILGSGKDMEPGGAEHGRRVSVRRDRGRGVAALVGESRRKPQIVGIAADILADNRPDRVEFLGRPMLINPGPGALAYAMRAALFHAAGVYEDGRIRIRLIPGPVVEEGMKLDDWMPQYRQFLLTRLAETATGIPENLFRWKRTMRGLTEYETRLAR